MIGKLLDGILREYVMHLTRKFGQVSGVERILAHLVLFGTCLILLGGPEIQEYAVLLHTAGQQQAVIAQYVAASGLNHPVDRSHVTLHIIPVLPLTEHDQRHLDDDERTPKKHEQKEREVLARHPLLFLLARIVLAVHCTHLGSLYGGSVAGFRPEPFLVATFSTYEGLLLADTSLVVFRVWYCMSTSSRLSLSA